jgi:hypothetical protein
MAKIIRYYSIISYEWLPKTGDADKILFHYSISEGDQGIKNKKVVSIVVKLSRFPIGDERTKDEINKAKLMVAYLRLQIENAIISGTELPSEILITSNDTNIPTNLEYFELKLGKWDEVVIEKRIGFLSSN